MSWLLTASTAIKATGASVCAAMGGYVYNNPEKAHEAYESWRHADKEAFTNDVFPPRGYRSPIETSTGGSFVPGFADKGGTTKSDGGPPLLPVFAGKEGTSMQSGHNNKVGMD